MKDIKLSSIESRLYAWIRSSGEYTHGGWSRCKATNRALGFLRVLNIQPTIKKPYAYFTFEPSGNHNISFWDVDAEAFIEEFYFIRNFAKVEQKLKIDVDEEIPFMMMLDQGNSEAKMSEGRVQFIMRKTK